MILNFFVYAFIYLHFFFCTASCRNAEKGCVHKTQSDRTFPRTGHKRELHAPGCPVLWISCLFTSFMSAKSLSTEKTWDSRLISIWGNEKKYNNIRNLVCSSSWMNDVHDVQHLNEESEYMGESLYVPLYIYFITWSFNYLSRFFVLGPNCLLLWATCHHAWHCKNHSGQQAT
jgi:hypothetical protein